MSSQKCKLDAMDTAERLLQLESELNRFQLYQEGLRFKEEVEQVLFTTGKVGVVTLASALMATKALSGRKRTSPVLWKHPSLVSGILQMATGWMVRQLFNTRGDGLNHEGSHSI